MAACLAPMRENFVGVFGCMSLLGCHAVLPLQTQIAYMRRKMAVIGLS